MPYEVVEYRAVKRYKRTKLYSLKVKASDAYAQAIAVLLNDVEFAIKINNRHWVHERIVAQTGVGASYATDKAFIQGEYPTIAAIKAKIDTTKRLHTLKGGGKGFLVITDARSAIRETPDPSWVFTPITKTWLADPANVVQPRGE